MGRTFGRGSARAASGPRRGDVWGIGLFADEEGSTTVAAAVAILMSLVLVFGMASTQRVSARAADVQAVADAGALAGMNVVAGYATVAQILDALVLSMGLVGMLTLAIGLVLSAIPLVDAAGPPVLRASSAVFEARAKLSRTAAQGLERLERAVPYLVAANSLAAVRANAGESGSYVGVAIPYPLEGASDFGLLEEDDVADKVEEAGEKGDEIDALAAQADEARRLADEALERGWRSDCGGDPSMRERAASLANLSGALNPDYPTSAGWDFGVPILRARAYYEKRIALEAPVDATPAEATRSAARAAFYRYALEQVSQSSYTENDDGSVVCDLRELPANTDDVRATALYTDAVWPCTQEEAGRTIHSYASCPGATGPAAGYASVAEEESGACAECPVCGFSVTDLGRAPAASTSIDNGFEHHWRAVVEASRDYEARRAEQAERERAAREASEQATDLFQQALERLSATRVELSPPGRYGCVCVVADPSSHASRDWPAGLLGGAAALPARAAVSGAVLARDAATSGNNVLAGFFDNLVAQGGVVGGVSSVLDAVMSAWGGLLVSYGDGYRAFAETMDSAFKGLSALGMGNVSSWLKDALEGAVELTALQPADLSVKKPVLVNSVDVMNRAGVDWYGAVRALVMAVQSVDAAAGPQEVLGALGVFVESLTGSDRLTVAEFSIPGTDLTIPLELDLGRLAGSGEAA